MWSQNWLFPATDLLCRFLLIFHWQELKTTWVTLEKQLCLKFFILLINNVVLVSRVIQLYIYMYLFFCKFFSHMLLQHTEQCSRHCKANTKNPWGFPFTHQAS